MKKFLIVILSIFIYSITAVTSYADTTCQPIYGGGQSCITTGKISINKTIQNPQTKQFVDNLSVNDPKFSGNQIVTFKISITNTDSTAILQTVVRDTLPSFLTFVSGPGNYDQNSKVLTFIVDNLNPSETRNFTIQAKTVNSNQLPIGVTCVINQVQAVSTNSGQAQDNSQLCIGQETQKVNFPVLLPPKVTITPSTGPAMIPLIGLLPAGIAGWILRKKSKVEGGEN